ncbi:MAG: Ig-like domain-containing protein, partial [Cellvibrionaceae bacterium]|nr:Ig-like domain-containing protein [Cellvibrionaceae bacterium]
AFGYSRYYLSDADFGAGNDTLTLSSNRYADIDMGDGDDTFKSVSTPRNYHHGDVDMGEGDNEVVISNGQIHGGITAGEGDDTVYVGGSMTGDINVSGGDNKVVVANISGNVTSGDGDDVVGVVDLLSGLLDTGDGNDTVLANSLDYGAQINLGSGSDELELSNSGYGVVNGGDGIDTLRLNDVSLAQWNANSGDIQNRVSGFEVVILADNLVVSSPTPKVSFYRAVQADGSLTGFSGTNMPVAVIGILSNRLQYNQAIEISTDGGLIWDEVEVDGLQWRFDNDSEQNGSFSYQIRIVEGDEQLGELVEQQVIIETVIHETSGADELVTVKPQGDTNNNDSEANDSVADDIDKVQVEASADAQGDRPDGAELAQDTTSNTTVLNTQANRGPSIESIEDNVGVIQGELENGGHTDDDIPALSGTVGAFEQVEIYDNGVLTGTVFANSQGAWRYSPTTALPEGEHKFNIVVIDLDGNRSEPSEEFNIVVDRTAEVVTDFRALDDVGAQVGLIGQGETTDDQQPTIRGGGSVGAKVEIYDNGTLLGATIVDANGEWEFSSVLALGEHRLVAYHTDLAGNTGPASEELYFIVGLDNAEPVAGVTILDGGDEHLSSIELSAKVGVEIELSDDIKVGDRVDVDVNGDGIADGSYTVTGDDIGKVIQVDIDGSEYAIANDNSVTATAVVVNENGLASDGVSDSSNTGPRGLAGIEATNLQDASYTHYQYWYVGQKRYESGGDSGEAGRAAVAVDQLIADGSEELVLGLRGLPDHWFVTDLAGNRADFVNGYADVSKLNYAGDFYFHSEIGLSPYNPGSTPPPEVDTSEYHKLIASELDSASFTVTFEAQTRDVVTGQLSAKLSAEFEMGQVTTLQLSYWASPLILDLDGDGVETAGLAEGVQFDIDADGSDDRIGWVGSDDALLVRDLNGNGLIDNGAELFGDSSVTSSGRAEHGFAALADLDSNADGVFDSSDTTYHELQIWQDRNSDGISQANELTGLAQVGVASIDLTATEIAEYSNGNKHGLRASWTDNSGQQHQIDDVWFAMAPSAAASPALEDLLVPNEASLDGLLPVTQIANGAAISTITTTASSQADSAVLASLDNLRLAHTIELETSQGV